MTAAALRRVAGWIDARTGLSGSRHLLDAKVVPRHRYSVFYYLGGMALFLFVVQVVTGLLLLLYYEPGTATAYESVKRISGEIPFGWLVRSIHRWSADIFIGVIALHLFEIGTSCQEAGWVYGYKRCRTCGFTVRVILRQVPDAVLLADLRRTLANAFQRNVPDF